MKILIPSLAMKTPSDPVIKKLISSGEYFTQVKYDGVRALTSLLPDGTVYFQARSGKAIPNRSLQAFAATLPPYLDGELILSLTPGHDVFRESSRICRTIDYVPSYFHYKVFDYCQPEVLTLPYGIRSSIPWDSNIIRFFSKYTVTPVRSHVINSLEAFDMFESAQLAAGHEGLILRQKSSAYHTTRASKTNPFLVKVVRKSTLSCEIVGMEQLFTNTNPPERNELGQQVRSKHKENLLPTSTMGALVLQSSDPRFPSTFKVGTGFSDQLRGQLWRDMESVIGQHCLIEYTNRGIKDKPRHPVFKEIQIKL